MFHDVLIPMHIGTCNYHLHINTSQVSGHIDPNHRHKTWLGTVLPSGFSIETDYYTTRHTEQIEC